MSSNVKVGIIGAGRIGKVHAHNLARNIDDADPIAISDINLKAAQMLATDYGIQTVCENPEEMLRNPHIEAVIICSWADTHAALTSIAAQYGKHVFCEKPLDLDLEKAQEVLRIVDEKDVKLQIGFNRRFDPGFASLKQKIDEGQVGDVHLLRISSRDPAPPSMEYLQSSGGLFIDMTIHDFDMARFLVGEIDEVYASGAALISPLISKFNDVDTALIQLKFENGSLGAIDNSRRAVYGYDQRIEVFGSKGMIQANNLTKDSLLLFNEKATKSSNPVHFFLERYSDAFLEEMRSFITCVQNDEAPRIAGIDGLMPLKIGLAAKMSVAENRPVKITEVNP